MKTFEGFYSMKTHDEQNAYLFGLMRQVDIKRKRKKDSSRRTCTFEYFIRVRGRETQVCQTAFKNIHAITERKVRVLCKKMDDGVMFPNDNRGKNRSNRLGAIRLAPEIIDQIKSHIYSIVHTHRLKDFIRMDKLSGLEINIAKMWKDYVKTYEPSFSHFFESPFKTKKKTNTPEELPNQTQIISNNIPQEIAGPSSDAYCLAYSSNGNIVNLTDNYISPAMVTSNQYSSQHIGMGSYINADKINYYPQRQVVVQPGNVQQLISSDPLALPLATQQSYSHTHAEQNTFFIVQSQPAPSLKREQAFEDNSKTDKTKIKTRGPVVRQWRYTAIFHDEINGEILAAIKTRLPLYFSESDNVKKSKVKNASPKPASPVQQCQIVQCQQQQQQQPQQQSQQQSMHGPPVVPQSLQHLHG